LNFSKTRKNKYFILPNKNKNCTSQNLEKNIFHLFIKIKIRNCTSQKKEKRYILFIKTKTNCNFQKQERRKFFIKRNSWALKV
jgi:hypothetical protein